VGSDNGNATQPRERVAVIIRATILNTDLPKGRGPISQSIPRLRERLRGSVPLHASLPCKLTAEWRAPVRHDSEGRQTATEPIEPAREALGPPPPPSRTVAWVKATWSELCDWWKEGKQERNTNKRRKKKTVIRESGR